MSYNKHSLTLSHSLSASIKITRNNSFGVITLKKNLTIEEGDGKRREFMLMHHMLYSLSLHLSSSLAFQTTQTHLKTFHQHYHIIKTIRLFLYFYFGVWEASYFSLSTPKNKTQKGGIFIFFLYGILFIFLYIIIFFCSFFSSQQVANSSNAPFACCVADVFLLLLLNKLMAGEEITRI